jgi:bifunctional non-homologous end joining protein LigD
MALSRVPSRSLTGYIEPCLPTPAHSIPVGELWVHEIKHDGCRLISRRDGDRVRLFTRRGNDWTKRLPHVADALSAMPASSVTIDGEIVATDAKGVTDFDRLRSALSARSQDAIMQISGVYYRHSRSRVRGCYQAGEGHGDWQDQS